MLAHCGNIEESHLQMEIPIWYHVLWRIPKRRLSRQSWKISEWKRRCCRMYEIPRVFHGRLALRSLFAQEVRYPLKSTQEKLIEIDGKISIPFCDEWYWVSYIYIYTFWWYGRLDWGKYAPLAKKRFVLVPWTDVWFAALLKFFFKLWFWESHIW